MQAISICAIMKNESRHLEAFLKAIQGAFFDVPYEVVLLDTGSTDESVSIGERMGARVEYFAWADDFALAKNKCLSYAVNNLVLFLDCDEYVDNANGAEIVATMEKHSRSVGMITLKNLMKDGGIETVTLERVFDRRYYHYEYPVHEQVRTISGSASYERLSLPVEATHHGYESLEILRKKAARNGALLDKMLTKSPEDVYLLYQRGRCEQAVENYEGALIWYQKALALDVDPALSYVQELVVEYGNMLLQTGREAEALGLEGIYDAFGNCGDYVYLMGMIYLKNGLWESALAEFEKATSFKEVRLNGANTFLAYYHRGCIYEVTGNMEAARREYRKCGDFLPAQERLK